MFFFRNVTTLQWQMVRFCHSSRGGGTLVTWTKSLRSGTGATRNSCSGAVLSTEQPISTVEVLYECILLPYIYDIHKSAQTVQIGQSSLYVHMHRLVSTTYHATYPSGAFSPNGLSSLVSSYKRDSAHAAFRHFVCCTTTCCKSAGGRISKRYSLNPKLTVRCVKIIWSCCTVSIG